MSGIVGTPYETLADLKGVWQLAKLDESHALVLADSTGTLSLAVGNMTSFTAEAKGSMDLLTVLLP